MKQYYGKHLAFKEIFTGLNNNVTETRNSEKPTQLTTMDLSNIKKRIVDKQNGVIVEYSTKQLNSLKDIKERINAINKRIQVLKEDKAQKEDKSQEPQTEEVAGGNNQEELKKINENTDLTELQKMLGAAEEEFNNLNNNDIDLLKPDQPDQRENLNELTQQNWESKDIYDDITEFANKMIGMYNNSLKNLNDSVAENKKLNITIANIQESGNKTATEKSQLIDNLTAQLDKSQSDIKDLNLKISSGEDNFAAILDLLTKDSDTSNEFNETTELIFEKTDDVNDGLPIIKDNYEINDTQNKTLLELLKEKNQNLKIEKDKLVKNPTEVDEQLPFEDQKSKIKIAIYDKLLDLNNNQRRMMRLAILSKEQQQDLERKDANIDNFKENIPTLLKNLTKYNPIEKYTIIPSIEGQDYNGIMAQIYNSLLANNENLYNGEGQDMTILSDVNDKEDGVLIKLYKEKLNLENILDMIRIKFTGDYKNDIQIGDNRPGIEEQVKEVAAKKINYSYNGYNSDAASIAAAEKSNDANKKIPVEDFFKDMITKLEANTEDMEEMKKKVDDFLKEKKQNDEAKISKLNTQIELYKAKTTTNETYLEKFKKLQMNFMKFKKYIDSTNLNLTNLLKNKIEAIHSGKDAKKIFPKEQHRLLIKYDTETKPEAIDSQIAKMTTSIITNLLTSNDGTKYTENEGGGENTSDTNSTSLVIDDLSNLSQSISDGGYSKNKIKMNSISHKKRKRSIKKYK